MVKAIIYARNTYKKSIDIQVKNMQTYCQKEGIEVVAIVRDKRTGKRVNRWKLKKAIRLARKFGADLIVTKNISRISRDTLNVITYLNHIAKHNVKLRCADEDMTFEDGNAFSKEFLKSFQ